MDLERECLHISRSLYQRKGKLEFGSLKTASSYRSIELTPSNETVLREHRNKQEFYAIMFGKALSEDDLIFSHPDRTPLLPSIVSRAWGIVARKAGLKYIPFHAARHTHATILLKGGVDPLSVQDRLGHSSISTTLAIYCHVTWSMQRDASRRFDELLGN